MIKKIKRLLQHNSAVIFATASMAFSLAPGGAMATDLDVMTVPAASCQPDYRHTELIRMVNSAWTFRGDETGRATLYCSLPLRSSGFQNKRIGDIRIYYKDSDGNGTQSSVAVRLVNRHPGKGGVSSIGPEFNSNTISDEDYVTVFHQVDRTLSQNRIYSFRVTLERVSAGEKAIFTGIDFEHLPIN